MKWKFISDSFYHMIIPKNINNSWKKYVFSENSARKSPWSVVPYLRHNAPSYDVTGKGARNCSKKCVILENLWNNMALWKGNSCDKWYHTQTKLHVCCILPKLTELLEYTLMNELISELKVYCGPDKLYGQSNFGQYDKEKNRVLYQEL